MGDRLADCECEDFGDVIADCPNWEFVGAQNGPAYRHKFAPHWHRIVSRKVWPEEFDAIARAQAGNL